MTNIKEMKNIYIYQMYHKCHQIFKTSCYWGFNDEINELEGVMTIKFNDNREEMDPYYQKEGVKFYSITGAIVRQRDNMLNKGLGTCMYETAILEFTITCKHTQKII